MIKYFKILDDIKSFNYIEALGCIVLEKEVIVHVITDGHYFYAQYSDEVARSLFNSNISYLAGTIILNKENKEKFRFMISTPAHTVQMKLEGKDFVYVDLNDLGITDSMLLENTDLYFNEICKFLGNSLSNDYFKVHAEISKDIKTDKISFNLYQKRGGFARSVELVTTRVGLAQFVLKKVQTSRHGNRIGILLNAEPKFTSYTVYL